MPMSDKLKEIFVNFIRNGEVTSIRIEFADGQVLMFDDDCTTDQTES